MSFLKTAALAAVAFGLWFPGSGGATFGIPDRMHGGVLEGAPHKYFVAPASFHLSVWNPAAEA